MRLLAGVAATAAALWATGCGSVAAEREAPSAAALSFYADLADGAAVRACGELLPETRHQLEESRGAPCTQALAALQLKAGAVRVVDVYGDEGRVVLDGDTAFLSKFDNHWRIVAAGCTERQKLPYDCQLEH